MKIVHCNDCKQRISNDEIALNIKLLGKHNARLRCNHCLSKTLGCNEEKLREMTVFLKNSGCMLFQRTYID